MSERRQRSHRDSDQSSSQVARGRPVVTIGSIALGTFLFAAWAITGRGEFLELLQPPVASEHISTEERLPGEDPSAPEALTQETSSPKSVAAEVAAELEESPSDSATFPSEKATGSPAPSAEKKPAPPAGVAKSSPVAQPANRGPPTSERAATTDTVEKPIVIRNVTIKNFGKTVYKGDIHLQPTLDRIARGEKHSHRNDGSVFRNLEGRLPKRPTGYYREYVHPTQGIDGPGPQRVVIGKEGDIYYTADHYQTFHKVRE